jgi:hypothetical protein
MDPGELPIEDQDQLLDMDTTDIFQASRSMRQRADAHDKVVLLFLLPMPYSGEHDRHCNHLVHVHAGDIRRTHG